ncbi:membrane protein [Bordetella ansorpii]|uniref:Membrane protein n=1 Tax=Bordetella ansorpii TaxID=288768 RepID=A0A157QTR3_9BORD|nr:Tim44-like domain-containing protein [Bordetella ansorpii]SAI49038.1 membrane protein [Bordetella ansorpii]
MSRIHLSRFIAAALIAVSGVAMLATTFDAEARRAGGGGSVGRQSSNVTQQRQATTPPSAANNTTAAGSTAAAGSAAAGSAAAAGARSGASRWLGPIAGLAVGLGLAGLLSSLGLGGAFAEFMASMLLIALVVFAVVFLVRRLRGASSGPRPAFQGAGNNNYRGNAQAQPMQREALRAAPAAAPAAAAAAATLPKAGEDGNWYIPGDFDTQSFLQQAKQQFVSIQALWDTGNVANLREYLTDDLIAELKPQLEARAGAANKTDVVLLNAEMLGIETVSDGHLASVRFSGMLREDPNAEAFRFEEVWNLFKPAQGGWLLAGIQQIPVEYAS